MCEKVKTKQLETRLNCDHLLRIYFWNKVKTTEQEIPLNCDYIPCHGWFRRKERQMCRQQGSLHPGEKDKYLHFPWKKKQKQGIVKVAINTWCRAILVNSSLVPDLTKTGTDGLTTKNVSFQWLKILEITRFGISDDDDGGDDDGGNVLHLLGTGASIKQWFLMKWRLDSGKLVLWL